MSTMSEVIVLLWFVPVVLNIIVPLFALGCWLGLRLVGLCRQKVAVGQEAKEERGQFDGISAVNS